MSALPEHVAPPPQSPPPPPPPTRRGAHVLSASCTNKQDKVVRSNSNLDLSLPLSVRSCSYRCIIVIFFLLARLKSPFAYVKSADIEVDGIDCSCARSGASSALLSSNRGSAGSLLKSADIIQ